MATDNVVMVRENGIVAFGSFLFAAAAMLVTGVTYLRVNEIERRTDQMQAACPHCRPSSPFNPRRPTGEIGVIGAEAEKAK